MRRCSGQRFRAARLGAACQFGMAALAVMSIDGRARALVITPHYASSVTSLSNASDVENAFNYVCTQYENLFSDNITLNITVASTTSAGTLGGSSTSISGPYTYTQVKNALDTDASSATDTTAVATLPTSDPTGGHTYKMSSANAKALGFSSGASSDGTFTFGTNPFDTSPSTYPSNYTFDPANRAVSGELDFIGTAEHEVSEIMGRIPGLSTSGYFPYDLFRYKDLGTGTRSLVNETGAYFSIDNGVTDLKDFNYNTGDPTSDPQDWASGTNDSYNAFSSDSVQNNVTPVDVMAMDVIGYNVSNLVWTGGVNHTSWNIFNTANWKSASNSTTTYTDAALVVFDDTSSGGNAITLNQTVYPTSVTVNSTTNNYSLSGSGSIAGLGTLTKSGTSTFTISNANTYTGSTSVNQGTVTITGGGSIAGSPTITVAAGAVLNAYTNNALSTTAIVNANGTVHFGANTGSGILAREIGGLNITSGGSAVVSSAASSGVRTVLVTPVLTFTGHLTGAWTGILNLTNNDLIVHGGVLGNIVDQLKEGYASGNWNGAGGIISSIAAADTRHLTTLGFESGGAMFDGMSTSPTDVLVKYTYVGDANLDGQVNGADYQQIDNGVGLHLTGWSNGDFNYDGVVDGSDFSLIDNAFNTILATSASPLTALAAAESVPEPTSLALITLCAAGVLGRRRKSLRGEGAAHPFIACLRI